MTYDEIELCNANVPIENVIPYTTSVIRDVTEPEMRTLCDGFASVIDHGIEHLGDTNGAKRLGNLLRAFLQVGVYASAHMLLDEMDREASALEN
jgi:hypothetical protein